MAIRVRPVRLSGEKANRIVKICISEQVLLAALITELGENNQSQDSARPGDRAPLLYRQ